MLQNQNKYHSAPLANTPYVLLVRCGRGFPDWSGNPIHPKNRPNPANPTASAGRRRIFITRIWKTIAGICVSSPDLCFFTVFSPSSRIYDSDQPARHPLMAWTARPDYSAGRRRCIFPPDSCGSVPGWAQTRPGPTRGQPRLIRISILYFFFKSK